MLSSSVRSRRAQLLTNESVFRRANEGTASQTSNQRETKAGRPSFVRSFVPAGHRHRRCCCCVAAFGASVLCRPGRRCSCAHLLSDAIDSKRPNIVTPRPCVPLCRRHRRCSCAHVLSDAINCKRPNIVTPRPCVLLCRRLYRCCCVVAMSCKRRIKGLHSPLSPSSSSSLWSCVAVSPLSSLQLCRLSAKRHSL